MRGSAARPQQRGVLGHRRDVVDPRLGGVPGQSRCGCRSTLAAPSRTYQGTIKEVGWWFRSVTVDGHERAEEIVRISLRAFALSMRTATASERLYVALWNMEVRRGGDRDEPAEATAEVRIRQAYDVVARLDDEPLRCDNRQRRRLRRSLQRDEARLLHLATGKRLHD